MSRGWATTNCTLTARRIGDHVLDPGFTTYEKRVLYSTYDVTDNLKSGNNALGVIVGNGWFGTPRLRLQLNVTFSDQTTKSFFTSGMRAQLAPLAGNGKSGAGKQRLWR